MQILYNNIFNMSITYFVFMKRFIKSIHMQTMRGKVRIKFEEEKTFVKLRARKILHIG